jgi:hypothetical protein
MIDTEDKLNRSQPRAPQLLIGRRALLTRLVGGTARAVAASAVMRAISLPAQAADEKRIVTLYKDPQCGCCEGYADHLRDAGFEVNVMPTHDLPLLNEKYGIPADLQPCHISLIEGYVVGGHVPKEVVKRLLSEKPKIVGITLPGMPLGSPGMTGKKTAPFEIYELPAEPRKIYAVV